MVDTKTDFEEKIYSLIRGKKNFRFEVKNLYYRVFYENENGDKKTFLKDTFDGFTGSVIDHDFSDVPYSLPKPFPLSSKLPIICHKCFTRFQDKDFKEVRCYDSEWICYNCRYANIPPTK